MVGEDIAFGNFDIFLGGERLGNLYSMGGEEVAFGSFCTCSSLVEM